MLSFTIHLILLASFGIFPCVAFDLTRIREKTEFQVRYGRTAEKPAAAPAVLPSDQTGGENNSAHFLLDLLNSLETGDNIIHSDDEELAAIEISDTVRTVHSEILGRPKILDALTMKWRVVFPSLRILDGAIQLAELRIRTKTPHVVGVDQHHILSFPCEPGVTEKECLNRKLVKLLEHRKHRYDESQRVNVIDVTSIVNSWKQNNIVGGHMIELWSHVGTSPRSVNDTDTPIGKKISGERESKLMAALLGGRSKDNSGIFSDISLMIYSKTESKISIVKDRFDSLVGFDYTRKRRSTTKDMSRAERRRQKLQKMKRKEERRKFKEARDEKLRRQQQAVDEGHCRLIPMSVDFEEIGWAPYIIYPKNFNAYRCGGRCSGPLEAIHNPSNHAVMQDLVRLRNPGRAPEPCCIPTKLRALSMLYVEEGSVVVRHHEEMVVEECGCR